MMPEMTEEDDMWEVCTTGRSSNAGLEAWAAQPDGTFRPLTKERLRSPAPDSIAESNTSSQDIPAAQSPIDDSISSEDMPVPPRSPLSEANTNVAAAGAAAKQASFAELKAAGHARAKAAKAARAAEEAAQALAEELWPQTFDLIFDSTWDSARCSDFLYNIGAEVRGRTVLCFVPGFSSWSSLTQAHVDRWNASNVLEEKPGFNGSRQALSLVVKWACGTVQWSSENAQVEAAAAWQEAHGATLAAARAFTVLLQKLKSYECKVVVAAHSLGARVVLQALANDLAAPKVDSLLLLGSAVDNYALTGLRGTAGEVNGVIYDGVGAAPAEFPFGRLMGKCGHVALVNNPNDPVLKALWQPAEYARCGRAAPSALGLTGIVEEELEEVVEEDESWMVRARRCSVSLSLPRIIPCDAL